MALDRSAVRAWVAGQQAAEDRLLRERDHFLLHLSPERSLQIYLGFWALRPSWPPTQPSPLLWSMREVIARLKQSASGTFG